MELAKLCKCLGGEPGTSKARIDAFLAEPDTSTPIEREAATRSDPKQYSTLITDLEKQFTRGNDGYPHMLTGAYDLLVNFRNLHFTLHLQHQSVG